MTSLTPLPPVDDVTLLLNSLPEFRTRFIVPHLAEKPQNPIMDTLRFLRQVGGPSKVPELLPKEVDLNIPKIEDIWTSLDSTTECQALWRGAALERPTSNRIMSWDALRPSYSSRVVPSAFLSEQNAYTFASARYYVRPPLQDPSVQIVYATPQDLLRSLRVSLTGTSSPLHLWHSGLETFVLKNIEKDKQGVIVLIGKDEVVSASVIHRFLTIGTLMRRLESLLMSQRKRLRHSEPTHNAFLHALSSVLMYLRPLMAFPPTSPTSYTAQDDQETLIGVWTRYSETEEILEALASLCNRDVHISPEDYSELPCAPERLLSLTYEHLHAHIKKQSSRVVNALFAFILTNSSQDYLQGICASVGYGVAGILSTSQDTQLERLHLGLLDLNPNGDHDDDLFDDGEEEENPFPSFIEPDVAEALPKARKSLKILRAAQPDHPLLTDFTSHRQIEWFWTEAQVEAAWIDQPTEVSHSNGIEPPQCDVTSSSELQYKEELKQFRIFDLEPGTPIRGNTTSLLKSSSSAAALHEFVARFPPSLPSLTPTLSHLINLVLAPLLKHIASLSSALMSVFLSPTTYLYLPTHLTLLRSYLLLTSPSFKSRLAGALFSDSAEHQPARQGSHGFAVNNMPKTSTSESSSQPLRWAVGLSPSLLEGDSWPPGGADLSFYLRTVIIDSLELSSSPDRGAHLNSNDADILDAQDRALQEAEYRLGFALRDLPAGTGKEKWLDPLAIEALDFLYMDYKPPHPLEALITPTILSKFHRMFAFNLRLMRVESVVRALFRMTNTATDPLFPTLTPSNKKLLHFRFVAHSFVTSLSSYVYDTVIRGRYDEFIRKVSPPFKDGYLETTSIMRDFSDVFALADFHSKVLDDILSACLLRSGQKAVGDCLRELLEIVLKFGILAGNLKEGRIQEYQASPALDNLFRIFQTRMMTVVKVLRALVDKGTRPSQMSAGIHSQTVMGGLCEVRGVTADLQTLLVRLDVTEWWTRTLPS